MDQTPDTASVPELNPAWAAYITPFAQALEITPEEVTTRLVGLVGRNPGALAITALKKGNADTVAKVTSALGLPDLLVQVAYEEHLREQAAAAEPAAARGGVFNLLPDVPDDDAWLTSLKMTGALQVGTDMVKTGIRAALAHRAGMYTLPEKIVARMLEFAKSQKRPVSPNFYPLRNMLTRRNYGDLFAALDGVDGSYATDARKREFTANMSSIWKYLSAFNRQLKEWNELYLQMGSNPAAIVSAISALTGGRQTVATQYPPVEPLREEAEQVIEAVNEAFAGDAVPVAMALAWEAKQIREALLDTRLPTELGLPSYEVMIRELGVEVTAADVRAETSIIQFILGVMKLPEVDAATECEYVSQLYQLGISIPWERLLSPMPSTARG